MRLNGPLGPITFIAILLLTDIRVIPTICLHALASFLNYLVCVDVTD